MGGKNGSAFPDILLLAWLWSWPTVLILLTKNLFSWVSLRSDQCHNSLGRKNDKAPEYCLLSSHLFF